MRTLAARMLALSLLALAGALPVAGCGSTSSAPAADDPAGAVPASAPLYAEAVVQPTGALKANVDSVARRVLRTNDPAAKIAGLFDSGARSYGLTWKEDVQPWLGSRAGAAITGFGPKGRPYGVIVLTSRDDAKARAAIAKARGLQDGAYKGVHYRYEPSDGFAAAVTGGRVLVGSEAGVKAAIDATTGDSLAESGTLAKARQAVPGGGLGFVYADVPALVTHATAQAGSSSGPTAALLAGIGTVLPQTLAAQLGVQKDQLTLDAALLGSKTRRDPGAGGADAVAALPGDSWLALGVGDVGGMLQDALAQASSSGLGAIGVSALEQQFRTQTGLDLQRDLLSWMGDAGIFVRGLNGDVSGALVVHSKDPAASRRAVEKLPALVRSQHGHVTPLAGKGIDAGFTIRSPGSPVVAVVAAGDRFVVAVGKGALHDALAPAKTLASTSAFTQAAGRLGGSYRPALFVDLARLSGLLDSGASAKPALGAFGALVAGAKREGDVIRVHGVATLR